VGSQVLDQVGSQVGGLAKEGYDNYRTNQFWSSWAAYVSFFRDVCGWDDPVLERFALDEDLMTSVGWTWWHENILALSDRPQTISRDAEGRLHSETGKAIEYRDGWGFSSWHGTVIPNEWITNKESITPEVALKWENIEQRRCACEIVGWDNIIKQLNPVTIDKDDPEIGELIEVDLPDSGKERFLRVRCGTGRDFALPVDPSCKTAIEANLWTYGLEPDHNFLPEVRT